MSATGFLNEPVDVTLAGKPYKVRRLSIMATLAVAERYIVNTAMDRARVAAGCLDGDQRLTLVKDQVDKIPAGYDLEQKARDILGSKLTDTLASLLLYAALKTDQPTLTEEDAAILFDDATAEEFAVVWPVIRGKKKTAPAAQ